MERRIIVPHSHSAFRKSLIFISISGVVVPLLLLAGSKAYACEVLFLPPVQEAYDNSAAVFSGRAADFQKFNIEGIDRRVAFFEVDRYWKSPSENDYKQLIVITGIDSGTCGVDFETGKEYLVYADTLSHDNDFLETSIGTRTQPIEYAQEDLVLLGEGSMPSRELRWDEQLNGLQVQPILTDQEQEIPMTLPIVGIGAAIAGAVAFFSLRRLKERK